MKQEKTFNRDTLIALTGLFAVGSVVRGMGRGSRAQDPEPTTADIQIIPLEDFVEEWQENVESAASDSDLPVLWSKHAPRDSLMMLDVSGLISERFDPDTVDEDDLREIYDDLKETARFFNSITFPVKVYRGVNVVNEERFQRTVAAGDFGEHWSTSPEIAEAFAHGLHDYSESVNGSPAVMTGVILSPKDVRWGSTFGKFMSFSISAPAGGDHYSVELQLNTPKVSNVEISRPKKRYRRW